MERGKLISLFFVLMFLFSAPASQAHGVRVFAWSAGDSIKVEVSFRAGQPVHRAEISVRGAATGRELLTGTTGDNGLFQFPIPERAAREKLDLKIVADCGAGHRGEWLLKAEDYLELPAGLSSIQEEPDHQGGGEHIEGRMETVESDLNERLIRRIIAEELEKKLSPLKREMHQALKHKVDIHDFIGAIGWFLGLGGIAAWIKSRKDK